MRTFLSKLSRKLLIDRSDALPKKRFPLCRKCGSKNVYINPDDRLTSRCHTCSHTWTNT